MTLGEKLTQARKAAGLTQADVAAKLNVSRQAVSRWESGQSKPSTERLLALGELYGVSIDQLLNTENVEMPAVETVSAPPEMEPREPVIPEKRRTRVRCKHYAYQSGAWVETKEADTQFESYLDMARWRVRVSSSMEPSQSQTQFRMV